VTPGQGARAYGWVADTCLRLDFGAGPAAETLPRVHAAFAALTRARLAGVRDVTPAYATLLVTFDAQGLDPARAEASVLAAVAAAEHAAPAPGPLRDVATCFAGGCAPDLPEVARLRGLAPEEVVARFTGAAYVVAFLGFAPGFPYLAGLPDELATPRLDRPRLRVPAGSVAVAGRQAGIYPRATPGGWRLVGRTALPLFDPDREPPALLVTGDRVQFVARACAEHARGAGD
jgi:KipI family sensor histidine kinase inhibitor